MRHSFRACLALLLAILVGWPQPVFAQERQPTDPLSDWARVARLRPATRIRIDAGGRELGAVRLLAADQDGLLFLNTEGIASRAARERLSELAEKEPDRLAAARQPGTVFQYPGLTLSSAGLRLENGQMLNIDRVLVRIERPSVERIAKIDRPLTTGKGILLGLVAGFGVSVLVDSRTEGICYGCGFFWVLGMTVGGFVGRAYGNPNRHVVYVRPSPAVTSP